MSDQRVSRDAMLMEMANVVAKRGTCTRAWVGVVIASESRVISTGYVGSPTGQPHCLDVGCSLGADGGCERTVHGEANAIAFAAKHGTSIEGSSLYTLKSPCMACAKLIINSGIREVVWWQAYRDERGLQLLEDAGLTVRKF
jgi:dCMP deaminase